MQKLDYKDAAIHNYLLSLYAQLQPDKLMVYLNFQGDVRIIVAVSLSYYMYEAHTIRVSTMEYFWWMHDAMTYCSIVVLAA